MALQCIVEDHRNRNLEHYTNKPLLTLARLQQADGSFGSLHGTALAAQVCNCSSFIMLNFHQSVPILNFSSYI